MPHEYKTTRRVEFPDTDMAGIVYFANFFKFMESTEHEFFRSLGLPVHVSVTGNMAGWARVQARCDYGRPAHYPDLLEIHLVVRDKTQKTLRYSFDFRVIDETEGQAAGQPGGQFGSAGPVIARGELVVAHVARTAGEERIRGVPIPDQVARLVQVAPTGH